MRIVKGPALAILLVVGMQAPAAGHENKSAIGAGPGDQAVAVAKNSSEHAHGATTPAGHDDAAMSMGGQDIAGDDMASHGDHHERRDGTFWERLNSWLGRVHTAVIHFPIAMLIGAFAVELLGAWRGRPELRDAARVMLVVGAIGAVAAAVLGWFAGGFFLSDRNPVLMIHRWLGTMLAVLTSLLAYFAVTRRGPLDRRRTAYIGLLGIIGVAVAVQGYLGGSFMHGGLDHLAF